MATVRRGFTLLELLIVIVVILILASLLIIGINRVLKSSKEQATKLLLGNLQGMLAELDAKTHLAGAPPSWIWFKNGGSPTVGLPIDEISNAQTAGITDPNKLNFWKVPGTWVTGTRTYNAQYDAMDAPGLMTDASPVFRNGCRAVLNTQLAMRMMLAIPANRASIQKTSTDRLFVPEATGGSFRSPGVDGTLYTADDTATTETPYYVIGAQCTYLGARFLCGTAHLAAAAPTAVAPNPPDGNWTPDPTPSTPLVLDSWNNPMIFVPGTGLRVRLLNGANDYLKSDGTPYDPTNVYTTIIISPEGQVGPDPGDPTKTIVIKPGRPFFASAGPDGDFAKGDDNVYSFQP